MSPRETITSGTAISGEITFKIGYLLREFDVATIVRQEDLCLSACAMAFRVKDAALAYKRALELGGGHPPRPLAHQNLLVDPRQEDMTAERWGQRHDQEAVVPPGVRPGNGPGGVSPTPVGDKPFVLECAQILTKRAVRFHSPKCRQGAPHVAPLPSQREPFTGPRHPSLVATEEG